MTDHCIIKADFCNFRPVAGRKVLQLYFEVPMEEGDEALKRLGGMPQPGSSRWCAIALLNDKPVEPSAQAERSEAAPKKAWSEYARSQQAALLLRDFDFCRYIGVTDIEDADAFLKRQLRIKSKKELDLPENHARWDEFVAIYKMKSGR